MDELKTLEIVIAILLIANIVEFALLLGKVDWLTKQYEEWIRKLFERKE